jgi:hypothetical protein
LIYELTTPQSEVIVEQVQEIQEGSKSQESENTQISGPIPRLIQHWIKTVNPECITDLFGLPLNMVVSQIESPTIEGTTKQDIEDHFNTYHNPVVEPSFITKVGRIWFVGNMEDEERRNEETEGEATFGFPILDLAPNVAMKNIPPSVLPNL